LRRGVAGPGQQQWVDIESLAVEPACAGIVGRSPLTWAVLGAIKRFAPYKGTVLVTGESGTGKELVAQALHQLGPYADGPLVTFNCSNLISTLAESQLFGHVKGAFTHAIESALGCFRQANHGTLLLDEVGELPLELQSKLLRAVELQEVQPVGSTETFSLELRLVASTNRNLREMIKAGTFRADLYYRLEVASIRLPPLRDRIDDVGPLTAHFVQRYNREFGKAIRLISSRALDLLYRHQWPGNVRELAHVIERGILLNEGGGFDLNDLPPELNNLIGAAQTEDQPNQPGRAGTLEDIVKETVERSLREARGDCAVAARMLGISRPAIYRKMLRFGITNSSHKSYRGIRHPGISPAEETPAASGNGIIRPPGDPVSDQ
jgi:DNA-binding NtrC family response regulator